MPGSSLGIGAQLDLGAAAAVVDDLGYRVRQPAGADVVDRRDRVVGAQSPARVDDFLRAPLHLGIAALHRSEVQCRFAGAAALRRCRSAAEADQHRRAAEHDELGAGARHAFGDVRAADAAQAAGDHDRLVIAAPNAVRLEQARAEVACEVRPAELVVEARRADRPLEHDRQRRGDPLRLARRRAFPRLPPTRQLEMRHGEAHEPRFRLRAAAGRAFVADLAARARRRTRKRRDRRRMVVRLDLHDEVYGLVGVTVDAGRGVGPEPTLRSAGDHGRVVLVSRQHARR